MAHSEATRKRISEGVKRRFDEIRRAGGVVPGGRKFQPGHDPLQWEHKVGCKCARCSRSMSAAFEAQRSAGMLGQNGRKGAKSRGEWERRESSKLVEQGYEVFAPSAVCDRVAIKDGRVFFVEFKQPGQSLRDAQQRVRDAAPDNYLVLVSECRQASGGGAVSKTDLASSTLAAGAK